MKNKMLGIAIFTLVIVATVLPVAGLTNKKIISGTLQTDLDWDYTTNPPNMYSIPSGNVGIGTNNPERKLHVAASSVGPIPIVYIQQIGTGRGLWVNTTNGTCGIVSEAGNHGLRVISAGGNGVYVMDTEMDGLHVDWADKNGVYIEDVDDDGVHVENAGGWAGYFNGKGFFNDTVGIGILNPTNLLHVAGTESTPLINVENNGPGRGIRVNTSDACAIWVENAGNHGLRITDAGGNGVLIMNANDNGLQVDNAGGHGLYIGSVSGDGIHVLNAGGWAGYFDGKGFFGDFVGIGTNNPGYLLDVSGGVGVVASFSGRVKGANAVFDDEFVTKGQVNSISTNAEYYTPTGTSDTNGEVGDTTWDSNYFYVKTSEGWKRAALETWESNNVMKISQ